MVTANGHENVCFISVWRDIMKNRRAAAVAFLTAVLIILQFFPAQAAEVQELYALSAVLMDGETGRVLYGKEAYKARPNASTTKVMTCIMALEMVGSVVPYLSTLPTLKVRSALRRRTPFLIS